MPEPHEAHWYESPQQTPLRQGDIFFDLQIFRPAESIVSAGDNANAQTESVGVQVVEGNWIVLDASCDVDHGDGRPATCQYVIVAPVMAANTTTLGGVTGKELEQRLEVIRRGGYPGKFLLSAFSEASPSFPISYVEFRGHLTTPHSHLLTHISKRRLRIKSPWREAFGNWVGNCISRVGPEDNTNIPRFVKALHDAQRLRAGDG